MNNIRIKILSVAFGATLLSACGGDSKGLLDNGTTPKDPVAKAELSAFPQAMVLSINHSKPVDLTPSVIAKSVNDWSMTSVEDKGGLGEITNKAKRTFDYKALAGGLTELPYVVQGDSLTSNSEVLVAINEFTDPTNTLPSANDLTYNIKNNETLSINLRNHITDADGDRLAVNHLVSPTGRFTGPVEDGDALTVTFDSKGFIGVDTAVYSADDGRGGYDVAYIVVNVADANPPAPNTPPTAKDFAQNIESNKTPIWDIDLNALGLIADADDDELEITQVFASNNRAEVRNKTSIRYIPGDFIGIDQFTYLVSDGKGGSAAGTITVTVSDTTPENSNPTAESLEVTGINENSTSYTPITVADKVSDADGDALRIVSILGGVGEVNISTADPLEILYMPKKARGEDTFSYVVTDDKGGYAIGVVKVVLTQNAAPVARIAKVDTKHNLAKPINLADYISDAETATSSLVVSDLSTPTAPATATLAGQVITFTPNGFVGVETLTYKVSDGEHETEGTVIVSSSADEHHDFTVRDIALNIDLDTYDGNPVTVNWLANVQTSAPVGDTFKLVNAVGAALGTVSTTGGNLTYTPRAGMYGQDRFVITVSDSRSPINYAQGFVSVTLTPPPPPEITAIDVLGAPFDGNTLSADIECTKCDISNYQYDWSINGLTVSTEPTYLYKEETEGYNLRLSVVGRDSFGQQDRKYSVFTKETIKDIIIQRDGWYTLLTNTSRSYTGGYLYAFDHKDISNIRKILRLGSTIQQGQRVAAITNNNELHFLAGFYLDDRTYDIHENVIDAVSTRDHAVAIIKDDKTVETLYVDSRYPELSADHHSENLTNVEKVFAIEGYTNFGFIAVKMDGTAYYWGKLTQSEVDKISSLNNISNVIGDSYGVAILYGNGKVEYIGDSGSNSHTIGFDDVKSNLNGDVKNIYVNASAGGVFVAIKEDGTFVTWGNRNYGANRASIPENTKITSVAFSDYAIAFLTEENNVVTTGSTSYGHNPTLNLTNIVKIIGGGQSFAALDSDGKVSVWGTGLAANIDDVSSELSSNVIDIKQADDGRVALKNDGSAVFWGGGFLPEDSSTITHELTYGIDWLETDFETFVVLTKRNKLVSWGGNSSGTINVLPFEMPLYLIDTNLGSTR
ncbi:putative lipoprotein [Vibrio ponticus]|nr:putative lipoprotein [Vibrio ponticus]